MSRNVNPTEQKLMEALSLFHYTNRDYKGPFILSSTTRSEISTALLNAKVGLSFQDISNLDATKLDKAINLLADRIKANPIAQKNIVYDGMRLENGKGIEGGIPALVSVNALRGLGYKIDNRKHYDGAFSDYKHKTEAALTKQSKIEPGDLKERFDTKAQEGCPPGSKPAATDHRTSVLKGAPVIQGEEAKEYADRFSVAVKGGITKPDIGLLDIRPGDGHLIHTVLDKEKQVKSYDVTKKFNDIPGLSDVPVSPKVTGLMKENYVIAKEIIDEGKSPFRKEMNTELGIVENVKATMPGWGFFNDVNYEMWIRENGGRLEVRLVTDELYESGRIDFHKAQLQTLFSLGTANDLNQDLEKGALKNKFRKAAAGVEEPQAKKDIAANAENKIAGPDYNQIHWKDIETLKVTDDTTLTLKMVAGANDEAQKKGVIDIAEDGRLILIRKTGEGDNAKIEAHHVSREIDKIPGLSEVPLSQKAFAHMARVFGEAKAMEGFDPKAGVKEHRTAEIEGWGMLNDEKYDLWVRQGDDGRLKVNVVTREQQHIERDILGKAEVQTSELEQVRATKNQDCEPIQVAALTR